MKKLLLVFIASVAFAALASAQPRAVGIRAGYGGEVSYQHGMAGEDFLELDLGLVGGAGFYLTGIYDFSFSGSNGFNFYAGPGAQLGAYQVVNTQGKKTASFSAALVGQLGVEYFIPSAPIQLSFDWRPAFYFAGSTKFGWTSFALGLRYSF